MTSVNTNTLQADARTMADAIRLDCNPQQIILFGSVATGKDRADSDIDLLIVQPRERWQKQARHQEIGRLRRALPRVGKSIDLLLYTPAEVERWRDAPNHLVHEAVHHGRMLYERA